MRSYFLGAIVSFILALLLTPLFRHLARNSRFVDRATGDRKLHTRPVPRVGGWAILVSFFVPIVALILWDNDLSALIVADSALVRALSLGTAVIVLIGLIDDGFDLPAIVKLVGQIAAALVVCWVGISIDAVRLPGLGVVQLGVWAIPLTVFWVVLITNAFNLIDGMDGLAASSVSMASGTLFLMAMIEEQAVAAVLLACLFGSALGFLRYNLRPASVFLGDTGSLFAGFVLAVVSIHHSQKSYALFTIIACLLAVALPLFDLSMAVVRRFLMGRPLFEADQLHVHHVLLRKGMSQGQTVRLLLAGAAVAEVSALALIVFDDVTSAIVLTLLLPLFGGAVHFLGYARLIKRSRQQALFEEAKEDATTRERLVQEYRAAVSAAGSVDEVLVLLASMGPALRLRRLELTIEGETGTWAQRAGVAEGDMNLRGLQTARFQSPALAATLTVEWFQVEGTFPPLDRLLLQAIADSTWLALLGRRTTPT